MGADDVGRKLLGEVKSDTLHEIFRAVRAVYRAQNESDILGLAQFNAFLPQQLNEQPELDLEQLQYSFDNETFEKYISALTTRFGATFVEITSAEPCAGKSALLYLLTAQYTLPRSIKDIPINGQEGIIVFFDLDGRFDVLTLRSYMLRLTRHATSRSAFDEFEALTDEEVKNMISTALSHIYIFRATSFQSLTATMSSLPSYFLNNPATKHSGDRAIKAIVLDDISTFYWSLRAEQEQRRISLLDTNSTQPAQSNPPSTYLTLVKQLKSLSIQFECPIIATTWFSPNPVDKEPRLNPTFPVSPTVRLVVERRQVRPFGKGTSVGQAYEEKEARDAIVQKHEFLIGDGQRTISFIIEEGVVVLQE